MQEKRDVFSFSFLPSLIRDFEKCNDIYLCPGQSRFHNFERDDTVFFRVCCNDNYRHEFSTAAQLVASDDVEYRSYQASNCPDYTSEYARFYYTGSDSEPFISIKGDTIFTGKFLLDNMDIRVEGGELVLKGTTDFNTGNRIYIKPGGIVYHYNSLNLKKIDMVGGSFSNYKSGASFDKLEVQSNAQVQQFQDMVVSKVIMYGPWKVLGDNALSIEELVMTADYEIEITTKVNFRGIVKQLPTIILNGGHFSVSQITNVYTINVINSGYISGTGKIIITEEIQTTPSIDLYIYCDFQIDSKAISNNTSLRALSLYSLTFSAQNNTSFNITELRLHDDVTIEGNSHWVVGKFYTDTSNTISIQGDYQVNEILSLTCSVFNLNGNSTLEISSGATSATSDDPSTFVLTDSKLNLLNSFEFPSLYISGRSTIEGSNTSTITIQNDLGFENDCEIEILISLVTRDNQNINFNNEMLMTIGGPEVTNIEVTLKGYFTDSEDKSNVTIINYAKLHIKNELYIDELELKGSEILSLIYGAKINVKDLKLNINDDKKENNIQVDMNMIDQQGSIYSHEEQILIIDSGGALSLNLAGNHSINNTIQLYGELNNFGSDFMLNQIEMYKDSKLSGTSKFIIDGYINFFDSDPKEISCQLEINNEIQNIFDSTIENLIIKNQLIFNRPQKDLKIYNLTFSGESQITDKEYYNNQENSTHLIILNKLLIENNELCELNLKINITKQLQILANNKEIKGDGIIYLLENCTCNLLDIDSPDEPLILDLEIENYGMIEIVNSNIEIKNRNLNLYQNSYFKLSNDSQLKINNFTINIHDSSNNEMDGLISLINNSQLNIFSPDNMNFRKLLISNSNITYANDINEEQMEININESMELINNDSNSNYSTISFRKINFHIANQFILSNSKIYLMNSNIDLENLNFKISDSYNEIIGDISDDNNLITINYSTLAGDNNDYNIDFTDDLVLKYVNLTIDFLHNNNSLQFKPNSNLQLINSKLTIKNNNLTALDGNIIMGDNSLLDCEEQFTEYLILNNLQMNSHSCTFKSNNIIKLIGEFIYNSGDFLFNELNISRDLNQNEEGILICNLNEHELAFNDHSVIYNYNELKLSGNGDFGLKLYNNSMIKNYHNFIIEIPIESDQNSGIINQKTEDSTIIFNKNNLEFNCKINNFGEVYFNEPLSCSQTFTNNNFIYLNSSKSTNTLKFDKFKFLDGQIIDYYKNNIEIDELLWHNGNISDMYVIIKKKLFLFQNDNNDCKTLNKSILEFQTSSMISWESSNLNLINSIIDNHGTINYNCIDCLIESIYSGDGGDQSEINNYGVWKIYSDTDPIYNIHFKNFGKLKIFDTKFQIKNIENDGGNAAIELQNTHFLFLDKDSGADIKRGSIVIKKDSVIDAQFLKLSTRLELPKSKLKLIGNLQLSTTSRIEYQINTVSQEYLNVLNITGDDLYFNGKLDIDYYSIPNSQRYKGLTLDLIFIPNNEKNETDLFGFNFDYTCFDGQYWDLSFEKRKISTQFLGCQKGYYNTHSLFTECNPCDLGTYMDNYGSTACYKCKQGHFTSHSASINCEMCQVGTYQGSTGQSICHNCTRGHYQEGVGKSKCLECDVGYYNNEEGQSSCSICGRGRYSPNATDCVPCGMGEYNNANGRSKCLECEKGTYTDLYGSQECRICHFNTYQDQLGQTKCNTCPKYTVTRSTRSNSITECICQQQYYGPGGGPCLECPVGGMCDDVNTVIPVTMPGYWNSEEEPTVFIKCAEPTSCPGGTIGACNIEDGYSGVACGECIYKFYKVGKRCLECPSNVFSRIIGAFFILVIITILLLVLAKKGKNYFGSYAILLSFFQIIAIIPGMELNWPVQLLNFFTFLSFFNFNLELLAIDCAIQVTYTLKWGLMMTLPWVSLVLLILIYNIIKLHGIFIYKYGQRLMELCPSLFRNNDKRNANKFLYPFLTIKFELTKFLSRGFHGESLKYFKNTIINSFIAFLFIMYLPLCLKVLELFDCTHKRDGIYLLDADTTHQCFDRWWYTIVTFGAICGVVYIIGIPVFIAWLIWYHSKKYDDDLFMQRLGLLCSRYNKQYFFWELIVMARKFLIVVFQIYMTDFPLVQALISALVILIALLLQSECNPYNTKTRNSLEFCLLCITEFILLAGMIFVSDDIPNVDNHLRITLANSVIGLILFGIFLLFIVTIIEINTRIKAKKEKSKIKKLGKKFAKYYQLKKHPIIQFVNNKPNVTLLIKYISKYKKKKSSNIISAFRSIQSKSKSQENLETRFNQFNAQFIDLWSKHIINIFGYWYNVRASTLHKYRIIKLINGFVNYRLFRYDQIIISKKRSRNFKKTIKLTKKLD
ncbi:g protein-coupled receptor-related [Anaeramoeba flamelloides]|uniref:G protein-coupled receptor-related n=1 Tax=Anaeramoeba flamelloides TaxID=1746091 RepID=A0ABQ8XAA6_9EUKA|nr:g protein-coupled receptor-related [Anaeramoeba flamelloides]